MSYKIVQPSTNSDRVGRFAVSAGTPDYVITFPNETGEVATTSDLPTGLPTIYPLLNTYTDSGNPNPQIISEWNIPVIQGKVYQLDYNFFGESETNNGFSAEIYYQTSSFVNPLKFGGNVINQNGSWGVGTGTNFPLDSRLYGVTFGNTGNSSKLVSAQMYITFDCVETGTLRHIFHNGSWTIGSPSSSYVAGKSYLKVTQLN